MDFYNELFQGEVESFENERQIITLEDVFAGEEFTALSNQLEAYTSFESIKAEREVKYLTVLSKHDVELSGEALDLYMDTLTVLGAVYGFDGEGIKDKAKSVLKSLEIYARKFLGMVIKWITKFKYKKDAINKELNIVKERILELKPNDTVTVDDGIIIWFGVYKLIRLVPYSFYLSTGIEDVDPKDLENFENTHKVILVNAECDDECPIPDDAITTLTGIAKYVRDNGIRTYMDIEDVNNFGEQTITIGGLDIEFTFSYSVHMQDNTNIMFPEVPGEYKISEFGPNFIPYLLEAFDRGNPEDTDAFIEDAYEALKEVLTINKSDLSGMTDKEIIEFKQYRIRLSKELTKGMMYAAKILSEWLKFYKDFLNHVDREW